MAQFGNITNSGKAKISSKYGPRNIGGKASRNHKGIDIAYPSGTQITSPLDGVIEKANPRAGNCGGLIVINHGTFNGKNVKSKYCHVKRIDIEKGKEVKKGQVVGLSGGGSKDPGRGNSMGAHIHFEILEDGKNVNPEPYYTGAPSGQQTQLPSEFEATPDKMDSDENLDVSDDKKDINSRVKNNITSLIQKLFGMGQESNVSPDVVNEVLRFKEIIEEQTPTFLTNNNNNNNANKGCLPYSDSQLPIKNCKSRQANGNEITYTGGPDIISQDDGIITATTKGNFSQAVKIGKTEYFWNGSLNKQLGVFVSKGDNLGATSDNKLITRPVTTQNTKQKQNTNQKQNANQSQSSTEKTKPDPSLNITANILKNLMQGKTQAPTTSNESIDSLKKVINEEIKMFNRLIK